MTDLLGLVAAGHPATAGAAASTLNSGGNAVDAVVAAGFASAIAEPTLTSLAGGGFALVRPSSAAPVLVDFFCDTPGRGHPGPPPALEEVLVRFAAADQPFHCGPGSIAVPGCLPGYLHLHRRWGRLPLPVVVGPAIQLAHGGVTLAERQADTFHLLEAILDKTEESRSTFCPQGRLPRMGERLPNPALGTVLEQIAAGHVEGFAEGPLAAALTHLGASGDSALGPADLASYRVIERPPLRARFGDHTLLTNPLPSFGGTLLTSALALLDADALATEAHNWPPLAVRAMKEVDERRMALLAAAGGPIPARATARGTTHVSVWDADGNVASMTTSNGEGSGLVLPGTGIHLNNMLGEEDLHPDGFHRAPAGTRIGSMMSPSLVLDDAGGPRLVIGSGGSKRIRSAILQVVIQHLTRGLPLADSVAAPRVHWDADHIEAEPGFSDTVLQRLADIGPVNSWPDISMFFGGVNAVHPGRAAAGDPRRDGHAVEVS